MMAVEEHTADNLSLTGLVHTVDLSVADIDSDTYMALLEVGPAPHALLSREDLKAIRQWCDDLLKRAAASGC